MDGPRGRPAWIGAARRRECLNRCSTCQCLSTGTSRVRMTNMQSAGSANQLRRSPCSTETRESGLRSLRTQSHNGARPEGRQLVLRHKIRSRGAEMRASPHRRCSSGRRSWLFRTVPARAVTSLSDRSGGGRRRTAADRGGRRLSQIAEGQSDGRRNAFRFQRPAAGSVVAGRSVPRWVVLERDSGSDLCRRRSASWWSTFDA